MKWSVTGGASVSGTATCSSGSWTAAINPELAGLLTCYTLSASQADNAGNTGTAGKTVTTAL